MHFIEQMQLFRLSRDYIAGYFYKPASLSCLIGDFLTQFYFLKAGGAVIITGCLLLLWYLFDWVISHLFSWKYSYLLSLLVTALVTALHFTLVYPLAATISLILALAAFRFYTVLKRLKTRFILGIILIPVLYMAIGFGVYVFLLPVLLYEFKIKQAKGRIEWTYSLILVMIVLIVPLSMRKIYYLTPGQSYKYPITELQLPIPNFMFETLFSLDYEWYFNRPEKTIEIARKAPVKTRYVIYYYNLASAAINKLPENLLSVDQVGLEGVFVPINKKTNYLNLLYGNEVYYFVGDINAAQHYALMANTFSPKCVGKRMIRRMAETNIINGEYAAAEKYLKMLDQTLFYRRWAHNMEQYLYDDELCSRTPWIAEKKAIMPVTDHIKSNPNSFVNSLYFLLDDHPDNQAALNYLLCTYLLYKDIDSFYKTLSTYRYKSAGFYLPKLYQEALMLYDEIHKDDKNKIEFLFSDEVIQQYAKFKEKYKQSQGDRKALEKDFGNTYWYYLRYAV